MLEEPNDPHILHQGHFISHPVYKMPRYLRAFIYFAIRYFLKGGILDGYGGWMWNFWQGLWYRWIVDLEIGRLRRARSAGS